MGVETLERPRDVVNEVEIDTQRQQLEQQLQQPLGDVDSSEVVAAKNEDFREEVENSKEQRNTQELINFLNVHADEFTEETLSNRGVSNPMPWVGDLMQIMQSELRRDPNTSLFNEEKILSLGFGTEQAKAVQKVLQQVKPEVNE